MLLELPYEGLKGLRLEYAAASDHAPLERGMPMPWLSARLFVDVGVDRYELVSVVREERLDALE